MQVFSAAVLSNALFAKLAIAYGMKEKIDAHRCADAETALPQGLPKTLANAYEAYLGLVFRDVMAKTRPWTDLWDYFAALLTPEVFPDLEKRIREAQSAAEHGLLYNGGTKPRTPTNSVTKRCLYTSCT